MEKIDFKKSLKHLFGPSPKDFSIVEVPRMQFLMIDGHGDPNTAKEIAHRLNEITFNANLTQAIHLIGQLKTALGEEPLSGELKNPFFRRLQNLRLHRIAADEQVFNLGRSTKLDPRWERMCELRDLGAAAADDWLQNQASCLGAYSSIDCALL